METTKQLYEGYKPSKIFNQSDAKCVGCIINFIEVEGFFKNNPTKLKYRNHMRKKCRLPYWLVKQKENYLMHNGNSLS